MKGDSLMIDKSLDWLALIMYALAAVSGGLGGCAIAGHHVLRGHSMRISYLLAYGIVGATFGVLLLAYGAMFGVNNASLHSMIGNAVLAGAAGSFALASTNISARWVLKRLGIEVLVTVRRAQEERRADGDPDSTGGTDGTGIN